MSCIIVPQQHLEQVLPPEMSQRGVPGRREGGRPQGYPIEIADVEVPAAHIEGVC